ncbi:MAG: hypothetical protein ABIV47_23325 [Roseiflexaceae bacterium]
MPQLQASEAAIVYVARRIFQIVCFFRRTTNDERRTTNDQRPTTNDQRPTTNDQRPTTNDQRRTFVLRLT